jgi:hypothetical protein
MAWEVEVTDEFNVWWMSLDAEEQKSVAHVVRLLEENGTSLNFPYSSKVFGSRHHAMRELRIQHQGRPYRVLYIFDRRRMALLLLGAEKTGDNLWYVKNVSRADDIYDAFLNEIHEE